MNKYKEALSIIKYSDSPVSRDQLVEELGLPTNAEASDIMIYWRIHHDNTYITNDGKIGIHEERHRPSLEGQESSKGKRRGSIRYDKLEGQRGYKGAPGITDLIRRFSKWYHSR